MKKKLKIQFKPIRFFTFLVLITASSVQSYADPKRDAHKLLTEQITRFVESSFADSAALSDESESMNVLATPIDPRIHIPNCPSPFTFYMEKGSEKKSYFSVRTSCEALNWFTFTTVKLVMSQEVVVINKTLGANTVLNRSHLSVVSMDKSQMRHTGFSSVEDVIGARLKYRAREGQTVLKRMLCYVCEGDRITIAAQAGGMLVKTTGIAKEDGTIGDTIEVMNARSKQSVFAEVASTQQVIVRL